MKDPRDIIAQTQLFEGLPQDQVKELRDIAIVKTYPKGGTIFSEGDAGRGFFVVVKGLVKVYKMSAEGKEQILHIFGPGEPFGEVPVFSGKQFPASAQAIAESTLLFFPRDGIVDRISKNPSLAMNMLAVLSMRLRQFTVQIENLSLKEVPARLAGYLLYLMEEQEREDAVTLNISKGQLASLLGTIPETLSRIFAKLSGQKLIEVKDRSIVIMDQDKLRDLADRGRSLQ